MSEDERNVLSMPLLKFIALMIEQGRYDVDVDSGTVFNVQTGHRLKPLIDSSGYPSVTLAYSGAVMRPVRVHRMIGVKVWGAEAVKGRHVAHLDGNKERSVRSNLELKSPSDHLKYDYEIGVHHPKLNPKTSWLPCVRCGDPDGKIVPGYLTPFRCTGRKFGIDGQLCYRCHKVLDSREYRARKKVNP
jgi:hypothetical protein